MRDRFIQDVFNRFGNDPSTFRDILLIETDSGMVPFSKVMDPWQRSDFEACDPGWLRCLGRGKDLEAKMRVYLERGRGHSKTFDQSVMITHNLITAPRLVRGFAYAASKQ